MHDQNPLPSPPPAICLLPLPPLSPFLSVRVACQLGKRANSVFASHRLRVQFRGYSADYIAPLGWSGAGKSILLENLGSTLVNATIRELFRREADDACEEDPTPRGMAIMAEALRYLELTEGGDLVGFKESGSAAFVANILKEMPRAFFIKMINSEGEEWESTIEAAKAAAEPAMWTKFWDAFNKLAKGTGLVDVSRSKFLLSLLLVMQPDVLARLAAYEDKKRIGLYGRVAPVPFVKDPFKFSDIYNATYDNLLSDKFKTETHRLTGELTELGVKLLISAFVNLEFPPESVVAAYADVCKRKLNERAGEDDEDSMGDDDITPSQQAAAAVLSEPPLDLAALEITNRYSRPAMPVPERRCDSEEPIDRTPPPARTSSRVSDNSSTGAGSGSNDTARAKQLGEQEQAALAIDQLQVMLPRPDGAHQLVTGYMSKLDAEYHLQNSRLAKNAGKKVFAAAAGKASEHMLRRVPSAQCLRGGALLMKAMPGGYRLPLVNNGDPTFLKNAIKASLSRTDLELEMDFLAGSEEGAGLVPTVSQQSIRLSNVLATSSLKASYVGIIMGVPDCRGPFTPADAKASAMAGPIAPPVSREEMLLRQTQRQVAETPFFFASMAELEKPYNTYFVAAASVLQDKGCGYCLPSLNLCAPSTGAKTQSSAPLFATTTIKETGGNFTCFVKAATLTQASQLQHFASLGMDVQTNVQGALYSCRGTCKRESQEKFLRICSVFCTLLAELTRLDVLTTEGDVRRAALITVAFSGGVLSRLKKASKDELESRNLAGEATTKLDALNSFLSTPTALEFAHSTMLNVRPLLRHSNNQIAVACTAPRHCIH